MIIDVFYGNLPITWCCGSAGLVFHQEGIDQVACASLTAFIDPRVGTRATRMSCLANWKVDNSVQHITKQVEWDRSGITRV
jgi:hypothetical protein